jgi:glycosyltransferase involved in cell wall biosynthesis
MKILAVLPYTPSRIRVRPFNLFRELGRRHELTLFVAGPRPTADELTGLRTITDDVHSASPTFATAACSCARSVLAREPLQAAVNRSPLAASQLADLLGRREFDVVHIEHLRAAFLEAALPPDVPRVFDAVDCISLLWERTMRASHSVWRRRVAALELRPTRRYEAKLMGQFDRVAVTSMEDADALRALATQAPVTVVPNGVDLDYFRLYDGPRDPCTLVFSGKMAYHANVTAVLHFVRDILPQVRAGLPDVRLRIVGSDPPDVIRRLATDPRIDVTGYLPDLRPAIGSSTVAICPVTVKVGIQNKILEAMALGVPVVSSVKGAIGLAATAGQDLLVANDPTAFGRAVLRLLRDDALRARIAAAGRGYVERHHQWEAAADALEALYSQAIAEHQGRRLQPA